jgi:uncharacterized membrane protein
VARKLHKRRQPSLETTMRVRLLNLWENTRSSLWFVPSLLVLAAALLSALLISVDRHLIAVGSDLPRLWFGGTASAAQTMLATIAGSLIMVIAIAFSLTVIALQQAAGQFSPRVVRSEEANVRFAVWRSTNHASRPRCCA